MSDLGDLFPAIAASRRGGSSWKTRILEAEAALLAELARLAPERAADPRWLMAAAKKECCAARLIRALNEEKDDAGAGGDAGAGDPVFSGETAAECFWEIVQRHDRFKETFRQWREQFSGLSEHLDRFMKSRMGSEYARRVYGEVWRKAHGREMTDREFDKLPHPCRYQAGGVFKRAFEDPKGGAGAGPRSFDGWESRWSGPWTSSRGSTSDQFHIWDRTRRVGDRYIQPVSQSEHGFVDESKLRERKRANQVDLAINVFSEDCGITGWVSKTQGRDAQGRPVREELPVIGYRPERDTLVWISKLGDGTYILFFEWVDRECGLYGILGHRFRIDPSQNPPIQPIPADPNSAEAHGGVYRRPS